MFVTVAKLASYGLRFLRVGAHNKSLTIVGKLASPVKFLIRPIKKLATNTAKYTSRGVKRIISESSEKYAARVQENFAQAAKELGIPKILQPKLVIEKLPFNLGGAYVPSQHTVFMNRNLNLFSRIFPSLSKSTIRHELKHTQQYLDLARSGANGKLPFNIALPSEVARVAETLSPTIKSATAVENRLQQAVNCIRVNKRRMKRQKKLNEFFERVVKEALSKSKKPLYTVESFLGDSKKIKVLEKEFWARWASIKNKNQTYLDDVFETEARRFGKFYGLNKLVHNLTRKSVYII
jgi:hypothetical protein